MSPSSSDGSYHGYYTGDLARIGSVVPRDTAEKAHLAAPSVRQYRRLELVIEAVDAVLDIAAQGVEGLDIAREHPAVLDSFGLPVLELIVREHYLAAAVEHINADMASLKAVLEREVGGQAEDISVLAQRLLAGAGNAVEREYVAELNRIERLLACLVDELHGGEHPAQKSVHACHADNGALDCPRLSLCEAVLEARKIRLVNSTFDRICNIVAEIAEEGFTAALGMEAAVNYYVANGV